MRMKRQSKQPTPYDSEHEQIRWQPGERLHHLFEVCCDINKSRTAIIDDGEQVTYAELDARANQLARCLLENDIKPGDRVGIHLERSIYTYESLLAVLKTHAVFVPMDTAFPPERKMFIVEDAEISVIVTTSDLAATMPEVSCPQIALDRIQEKLVQENPNRLTPEEIPPGKDDLCYIIYTSGSTGRPKGVAIEHSSICTFVQVAIQVYGINASDRVYQGITISFDFSIEEIWPALTCGAAIVPGPTNFRRMGTELADFLIENKVTVLCCVPTLLATIDKDIPSLRTILVGGEACPQEIVNRWSRPDRRMLNTYGPTETTVTATLGELIAGKPVTIGRPMLTYTIYLLDEDKKVVSAGEIGEICIAGIGVARGYINRDELTRDRFIPDTFGTPNNPTGCVYRTGDLGRLTPDGEIEYLGRVDTQVKIRGYRIELTEIESIILEAPEVENAIVSIWQPSDGVPELVAYCKLKSNNGELPREELYDMLCQRLPSYMVPIYLEMCSEVPVLPNGKVNRSQLPPPKEPRLGCINKNFVSPNGPIEENIASVFADVLSLALVSAEDDFFRDLGGHSMAAAEMVSVLRKDHRMAELGLGDIYNKTTVRSLAQYITDINENGHFDSPSEAKEAADGKGDRFQQPGKQTKIPARNRDVWVCGLGQAALLYTLFAVLTLPGVLILNWSLKNLDWIEPNYLVFGGLIVLGLVLSAIFSILLPIALKWLLIGRVKSGSYPLWGWFFLRWWLVQRATSIAPLSLFSGTPLLNIYCRMMGARIGGDCVIETPNLHQFDLIEIGSDTSIGSNAHIFGYNVADGMLQIGNVCIGRHCYVGANSVIMPNSVMEDEAWLGDQSLLLEGMTIPAGESYSGSPAKRENEVNPEIKQVAEVQQKPAALVLKFFRTAGFIIAVVVLMIIQTVAMLPGTVLMFGIYSALNGHWFLLAAPISGLLFVLSLSMLIILLKRLVLPKVEAGLYSVNSFLYFRKWFVDKLMEMSIRLTNSLYATLYLPPFLRLLGVKIGRRSEISTISHITANLLTIEDESFIADIAHVGPARVYNDTFALKRTRIGKRSFVGNAAFIPSDANINDGTLIGILSVPPGGEIDKCTSWLGSPAIYLPRRQASQRFPDHKTYAPTPNLIARRLGYEYFRVTLPATLFYLKSSYLVTMLIWLLSTVSISTVALLLPALLFAAGIGLTGFVAVVKKILIGTYKPLVRPMWSTFVWRTELVTALYENVVVPVLLGRLVGTPFVAPILRFLGAKIGRRGYLETTYLTEFDLVSVGDDCAIGMACSLQTHLFEDRVMKMSHLRVGNGCSIGPRAIVLYDSVLEDDVKLDTLSLVMKGETMPTGSRWCGAPSRRFCSAT